MRYFIYAKPQGERRFQKIRLVNGGFYIEPNAMYATLFTDDMNDFPALVKNGRAENMIEKLRKAFPSIEFEKRLA